MTNSTERCGSLELTSKCMGVKGGNLNRFFTASASAENDNLNLGSHGFMNNTKEAFMSKHKLVS